MNVVVDHFHDRVAHRIDGKAKAMIVSRSRKHCVRYLCSLQHKFFDRGAFSLSEECRVTVSEQAQGSAGFDEWLLRFHGERLRDRMSRECRPVPRYLEWHRDEVFRAGGRP